MGSAREYERVADAIADADWRSDAGRREFTSEVRAVRFDPSV